MKRLTQTFIHLPSNLRTPCLARRYATKVTTNPLLDKIAQDLKMIREARDWKALDEVERTQVSKEEKLWEKSNILQVSSLMKRKNDFNQYSKFQKKYKELKEMSELASEENDEVFRASIEKEIGVLQKSISTLALQLLMRDEDDICDAIIQINAGAGGTESCDWAAMLCEMYKKWAITEGYQILFLEQIPGEIAGYKSCTLEILGKYAHGWLRLESGVHRLVRLSPFDSQNRRHTSFAAVTILPSIKENDENKWSEIPGAHLKIETYRASGAGGQHVNTTDSAIRITHIPSGLSVQCQSGRSQHQNKSSAMRMLRAKLYELETRQRETGKVAAYRAQPENAWGSQIRSYILQPYQLVKDTRTGYKSKMAQDVLNGHGLKGFLEALIKYQNKINAAKGTDNRN